MEKMNRLVFLIIIIINFINSDISNNFHYLNDGNYPFVLSTDDRDYYYVITSKESFKIEKETGIIKERKETFEYNKNFTYCFDSNNNNFINTNQQFQMINYESFISFEQISIGWQSPINGVNPNQINYEGCINHDNDFIVYRIINSFLIFGSKSKNIKSLDKKFDIYVNSEISCKFLEDNKYVCTYIHKQNQFVKLVIVEFKDDFKIIVEYDIDKETKFTNSALYDLQAIKTKILCMYRAANLFKCIFLNIDTGDKLNIVNGKDLQYGTNYFLKNCDSSRIRNEYLFCCAKNDLINCSRLNETFSLVKNFHMPIKGAISYLTIKTNNNHVAFFFRNVTSGKTQINIYYIYFPKCKNKTYTFSKNLNENKEEDQKEKLNSLFEVKTKKYYLTFENIYENIGNLLLNDNIKISNNQTMLIENNDYIFDYILNDNILYNKEIILNYSISEEGDELFSSHCHIKFLIKTCYESCKKCSVGIYNSNETNHNCIENECADGYYSSPLLRTNCLNISQKEPNWFLDVKNSKFELCSPECEMCLGPTNQDCICKDNNLFIYNNTCISNCPNGTYENITINRKKCEKCYQNCETCFDEGNDLAMRCDICKEGYIRNKEECFKPNDHLNKTFLNPDKNNEITSCKELYGKYILENTYECIDMPTENGYFISNNITGLISRCHNNCLTCYNKENELSTNCIICKNESLLIQDGNCVNYCSEGYILENNICKKCHPNCLNCIISKDNLKYDSNNILESMGCLECKNNSIYVETLEPNEGYCFPYIQYTESKITFNITEINKMNEEASCLYFNKSIFYKEKKCVIKPNNTYYILNNEENTGIIQYCDKACDSCITPIKLFDTNCINCNSGYYKTEDSDTNCILKNEIPKNYYINNSDNIYYKCFDSCDECDKGYDPEHKNMNCIKCKEGLFKLNGTNNCHNYSLTNKGYFLDQDIFYPCYKSCLTCYGPLEMENHNCISCAKKYYKLDNSLPNNCYEKFNSTESTINTIEITKETNIIETSFNADISNSYNEKFNKTESTINTMEITKTTNIILTSFNAEISISPITEKTTNMLCYQNCKRCYDSPSFEINGNIINQNCDECIDGYFFIFNTNNCFNNSIIKQGYYLNKTNSTLVWKKCYEKCETCNSDGNDINMNCISCKSNIINNILITPTGDCVSVCPNNTYEYIQNYSCLKQCPNNYEIDKLNNKCIFKTFNEKTTIEEFKSQIKNNITLFINSSNIINGSDFIAVVLSSDKMDPEEQLKNGISAVDLGNCTKIIKDYYNISKDANLIILNMESKKNQNKTNSDSNSFNLGKNNQIEVYDYSGRKLDLTVCKEDIKIMKYIGDIDELNIQSAKSLSLQGIDVFNASDEFFNDLCHQYDNIDGKDVILDDRRTDLYQNATFCQEGCKYSGMNYDLMTANCICNSSFLSSEKINITNDNNKNSNEELNFKTITKSFISNLLDFNIEVVKCYNLVFNKKIIINNIGFYIMCAMFILQFIFLFIYETKKLKSIKYFMLIFTNNYNSITMSPPSKYKVKKLNKKVKIDERFIKNKPKNDGKNKLKSLQKYLNNSDLINTKSKNSEYNYVLEKKSEIKQNSDFLKLEDNHKTPKKTVFSNFSKAININIPYDNFNNRTSKTKSIKNKIYKQTKIKKPFGNILNFGLIKSKNVKNINNMETIGDKEKCKKKLNNTNNKKIKLSNTDSDLQDMDYEDAIIHDKRSYFRMYWSFLVDTQVILGTFCTENYLYLFVIKLSFFICTFQISFFLNALFYTDEYISDAYHNNGVLDFVSGLPKSIYSFIATLITTNLLKMLSNSKSELMKIIREKANNKDYLEIINAKLGKLRKKLILYFILVFILGFLFLYYVTSFCAVYRYSQKYWIIGCLESFGIDSLVSLSICIILALLRYISIKKYIKYFYKLADIISTFL